MSEEYADFVIHRDLIQIHPALGTGSGPGSDVWLAVGTRTRPVTPGHVASNAKGTAHLTLSARSDTIAGSIRTCSNSRLVLIVWRASDRDSMKSRVAVITGLSAECSSCAL